MALAFGTHQLLLEAALHVREHRSAAVEGHAPAAGPACPAAPARLARVHRDPIADPHPRDRRADLDHAACDLVPEDQGLAHRKVADPPSK
jgi:hypothetical protein